jgi:hypothetical protein
VPNAVAWRQKKKKKKKKHVAGDFDLVIWLTPSIE